MAKEQYVALYVRVSSEEQVDGYSLEAQERVGREDAKLRGKLVYKVYSDAGVSGALTDRKGLNELLKDAKRECFGEVLVWTVSRVSRKLTHLLEFVDTLKGLNIAFRSLSESFDITTAMGQFALTMMGAVAEMQRKSWMESSKIGMENRAKSGRWGGGMMLGYRMVADAEDPRGGGKLEIVPGEAETVRRIFTLYADGYGYKVIATRLNAEGRTGKTGRPFTTSTIYGTLTDAVYVGRVRFGDEYYDGLHEPIISQELWLVVQDRLRSQSKPVKKTIDYEYLLSGLLRCPLCGSSMIPKHTKNRRADGSYRINHYYYCEVYNNRGVGACSSRTVRADRAEQTVLDWISDMLSSPFWLKRIVEAIQERQQARMQPLSEEKQRLEARLGAINHKQVQLLRRYEEDSIERDSYLSEMRLLKVEKESLQSRLTECEIPDAEEHSRWTEGDIRHAFASFRQILDGAEAGQKRRLLRSLIASIAVSESWSVSEIELKLVPVIGGGQEPMSLKVAI